MSNKILQGVNEATRKRNPVLFGMEPPAPTTEQIGQVFTEQVVPKDERELHDQFIAWLRVHDKGPIPFIHSRMDRKSTIRSGWPDFSVFYAFNHKPHCSCFVEFKMPGGAISDDQNECFNELMKAGLPVRVCYSLLEAIEFTREKLGL